MIRNRYYVEAIAFLSYVLFAMAWVGGAASMPQIMKTMNVEGMASASMISGAVTLAKIVGTFIAAWLSSKISLRFSFFISALLICLGFFTPHAPHYDLLLLSRFAMGLGGALMIVYFNPIVVRWFSAKERPFINGLNAVAFNLGAGIILFWFPDISALFGDWKNALTAFSIASFILAVLFLLVDFRIDKDEPYQSQNITTSYSYAEGLKDPFNWIYAITFSGLLSIFICVFTFYPQAGISQTKYVIGFGVVGTVIGMLVSRFYSLRLPPIRWSGLTLVISSYGLCFSGNATIQNISAMLLGISIFIPYAALLTLPQELPNMTGKRITIIFSIFYSVSYLISTVILWCFGWLVDISGGNYEWSFGLITAVSASLFIGSFFLPETGRKIESSDCKAEALATSN